MFICSTLHWIDMEKHFHSFHQLLGTADWKLKTEHTRILAPEVEVHYRLEGVSSASFNVSFKPWQKWYHDIHPVPPAFPAKIRGRQTQQLEDTYSNSLKRQPSLSHVLETEPMASHRVFYPISGLQDCFQIGDQKLFSRLTVHNKLKNKWPWQ